MGKYVKVIICDDHSLFRQGVKAWLETKSNIDIIGEVEDGLKLIKYLKHVEPDVILLDINMPVMDGSAALVEIKRLYPEIKVIMLTMNDSPQMVSELFKNGANAYLTKNDDVDEIYQAIMDCHEKGEYINEKNTKAILQTLREEKKIIVPILEKKEDITTLKQQPKKKFNIFKVLIWSIVISITSIISIYLYLLLKNNLEIISSFDFNIK